MKFCTRVIFNTILLVPAFAAPASGLLAQSADSSPSARSSGTTEAAPSHLKAFLVPSEAGSEVQGTIRFSMTGDLLSVTGRIEGLDPNKRYRLVLSQSGNLAKDIAGTDRDPVGKPTLQGFPADGRVILSKPVGLQGEMGILLADASGGVNIGTTVNGLQLAAGQNRVMGRTVILSEIADGDAEMKPIQVAKGLVKLSADKAMAQPSSLDELEPGEVWF